MNKLLSLLIGIPFLITFCVSVFGGIILYTHSHSEILAILNRDYSNSVDVFSFNSLTGSVAKWSDFFTAERYHLAKQLVVFGLLFQVLAVYFLFRHRTSLSLTNSLKRLKTFYGSIDKRSKLVIAISLGLSLSIRFFYAFYFYIEIDEAPTWNEYINQPFWLTLSYYPFPNNHIGYSAVSWFFKFMLPFPLSLRIVSIISMLLLQTLLLGEIYYRYKAWKAVLIGGILTSIIVPISMYASLGRGYLLMALLFYISILIIRFSAMKSVKSKFYLGLTLAFGLWVSPAFGYSFCIVLVYLFIKRKNMFSGLQVFGLSLLCAFFLYLPTILFSGFENLLFNKYLMSKTGAPLSLQQDFIVVMNYVTMHFTKSYIFVLAFIVLCLVLFKKMKPSLKDHLLVFGIALFGFIVYVIITGKSLAPRIVLPLSLSFWVFVIFLSCDFLKTNLRWALVVYLVIVVGINLNSNPFWSRSPFMRDYYRLIDERTDKITSYNSSVILFDDVLKLEYLYHYTKLKCKDNTVSFYTGYEGSENGVLVSSQEKIEGNWVNIDSLEYQHEKVYIKQKR